VSRLRNLSLPARALPTWVESVARAAVLGFGMLTARWRMTPAFLVIGGQRCGTTTLYRVLSEHPTVLRPTLAKGIGYFDVEHHHGFRWYRAHFPLRLVGRLRAAGTQTFESSGYYAFHPLAARRIAAELPGVKVVMLVRDPVERAYSAHSHELARGFETEDFETAVALEPERLAGEEERLRADPAATSHAHRHHAYLARGRYVEQLTRFADALGRESVYVMDAGRFFTEPVEELATLLRWLGLPAWTPQEVPRENARPRSPMSPDLHARLRECFTADDAALADWLGRPPSWRDPA
jgi:Sulfotransferase domain